MTRWLLTLLLLCGTAQAATVQDLVRAYPDSLAGFDGTNLLWRDGTRMPVGEAHPAWTEEQRIESGSILDMLAVAYPAGAPAAPPATDPGRIRNTAFFDRVYGDCRANQVAPRMVRIPWPGGRAVSISPQNGLDRALAAVSAELDALPPEFHRYLAPIAGTYNCRAIAGSSRSSMHGWGAAIDINTAYSDYWRWSRTGEWRNRIPDEVVAVFERHGFIWGGRWAHFDTMHFEYRPELFPARHPD